MNKNRDEQSDAGEHGEVTDSVENELEAALWNHRSVDSFSDEDYKYAEAVLSQYALCVNATESISRSRNQANAFFLTLHTGLLASITVILAQTDSAFLRGATLIALTGGIALSIVWSRLLESYRAINTAKFQVIGLLEQRLPASPFWRAEWRVLTHEQSHYRSLASIEKWVPRIAIAAYLLIVVYAGAFAFIAPLKDMLGG